MNYSSHRERFWHAGCCRFFVHAGESPLGTLFKNQRCPGSTGRMIHSSPDVESSFSHNPENFPPAPFEADLARVGFFYARSFGVLILDGEQARRLHGGNEAGPSPASGACGGSL